MVFHSGGLYMIHSVLRLSVTNCYLLQADNGFVLVDTGYDWEWETFRRSLDEARIGLQDIGFLILTHHHDDHAGLIGRLLIENPMIRVVMSRCTQELLPRGKNDRSHGGAYINRRVNALLTLKKMFDTRWTHTFPAYFTRKGDIIVADGIRLRDIGIDLDGKIIETPGHTFDSISVLLDDGDCLVGDAAASFLSFAGTKHCIIYLEDLGQYYASWIRIIDAGAKRILPAHGRPFGVDELRKNLHRNRQEDLVKLK
jgi:glyoxylase-like metal-dependent hydrolase (beta-lactamase superfamily II)